MLAATYQHHSIIAGLWNVIAMLLYFCTELNTSGKAAAIISNEQAHVVGDIDKVLKRE